MLNFSKIKVLIIYSLFILISFFALLNINSLNNSFINKKVNLGLDLQGGSYLLLEVDTKPLIKERIQDKVIPIKKLLKQNNISYKNFTINGNQITFSLEDNKIDKFKSIFLNNSNKNVTNNYIAQYNSFELDLKIESNNAYIFFRQSDKPKNFNHK